MGVDIHVKLYKYNKDSNLFNEITLFKRSETDASMWGVKKGDMIKVSVFNGRNHELFNILQNKMDYNSVDFPCDNININSYDENEKEDLHNILNEKFYFNYSEVSLADMKIYCLQEPKVVDYDAEWGEDWKQGDPEPMKDNPVIGFFDDIVQYIYFADEDFAFNPLSYYKVVYYFDN